MTEENVTTEQEQNKLEVSETVNGLTTKMEESFGKDVRGEFVDVYMTVVERAMGLTEEDEADVMQAALDFSALSMAIMGKEKEEIEDVAQRVLEKLEDADKYDGSNEVVSDVRSNMKHVLEVIRKDREEAELAEKEEENSAPEQGADVNETPTEEEDA